MTTTLSPARVLARRTMIKVPQVTALFWVVKLLTTAGGESVADLLADQLVGMKVALLATCGLLVVALAVQVSLRRYVVGVYWGVVVLVGIAGTLATDYLVRTTGMGEKVGTALFAAALAATFAVWYASERTLSIHSITTTRRELFYWAAVCLTFALGTAAGDLTAFALGWGFPASIALYGSVFAAAGIAHLRFGLNAIACFWTAYVLTRPLGASVADYLAFEHAIGGLGFGLPLVSAVFSVAIAAGIGYLVLTRRDAPSEDAAALG